ncbi:hypothetical protein BDI4_340015 [Burkholderia diffusa]|nr:hypothetical protein BDI4_340015 [Burkholderia diffusa]
MGAQRPLRHFSSRAAGLRSVRSGRLVQPRHRIVRGGDVFHQRRELAARVAPGVEAAAQRQRIGEARVEQALGHQRGRHFVRARAIHDELLRERVARDDVLDVPLVRELRARNRERVELAVLGRTHVEHHRRGRVAQQQIEFVDADPRARELADQRTAAHPAHGRIDGQQRDDHQQHRAAEPARAGEQPVDLSIEHEPRDEPDGRPQRGAERIVAGERAIARAERAGHRHRHERQPRNEAGDREHAHAVAAEEAFGFPHAGIARQRQPADRLQRRAAVAPPGDVPHGVADQRAEDRQRQHRQELRADHRRMHRGHRAEQHERRHRRHGQADGRRQDVGEDEKRPVLGDEVTEHDGWPKRERVRKVREWADYRPFSSGRRGMTESA